MGIDKKASLVERVYRSIPYSMGISNLDITSEENAIRFDWRGTRYRVDANGGTEEVGNGVLIGSDCAILMEAIIRGVLP